VLGPEGRANEQKAPVIELRNVSLSMAGNTILRHVNWSVRDGEHWALVGPNGAGKTAMLSLLTGDHPQAFAQRVLSARVYETRRVQVVNFYEENRGGITHGPTSTAKSSG